MALQALLWDVDGTLADTELHGHRLAFNAAFAEVGLPWRWDGPTYQELLAISGGRERIRHFLEQVQQEPVPAAQMEALLAAKQQAYATLARQGALPLRPGVRRLVGEAAQRGLRQALVTTSSRSAVAALLEGLGPPLASAFAFWICGEDVRAKKPSPEAYQQALEHLALPPAAVLALEDSPQGLAAALGAGLPCLLTLGEQPTPIPAGWWQGACGAVDHLGEVESPARVMKGPPCQGGHITLSWMEGLVEPR